MPAVQNNEPAGRFRGKYYQYGLYRKVRQGKSTRASGEGKRNSRAVPGAGVPDRI